MEVFVGVFKVIVPVSIFFVWVVRYQNIIEEFDSYGLPIWTRDLVGISKLTCAVMVASSNLDLVKLGAAGITVLMLAALLIHLKVKNPLKKMLPALSLMVLSIFIFLNTH
jgi:hypothetical protein